MKVTEVLFIMLMLGSCGTYTEKGSIEEWKKEIVQTEHDFARMAADKGIREAFLTYAAEDAVLMRNNSIVSGIEGITEFFDRQTMDESRISLEWEPDFVDVSASGDLAYTYGKFVFSALGPDGNKMEADGIFHTVWKRQEDGSWRFVYD